MSQMKAVKSCFIKTDQPTATEVLPNKKMCIQFLLNAQEHETCAKNQPEEHEYFHKEGRSDQQSQ